jgi:hypothetical protein
MNKNVAIKVTSVDEADAAIRLFSQIFGAIIYHTIDTRDKISTYISDFTYVILNKSENHIDLAKRTSTYVMNSATFNYSDMDMAIKYIYNDKKECEISSGRKVAIEGGFVMLNGHNVGSVSDLKIVNSTLLAYRGMFFGQSLEVERFSLGCQTFTAEDLKKVMEIAQ